MSGKSALCAGGCGRKLYGGTGSLPEGRRTCRECRRREPVPYSRRTRTCHCGTAFLPNDHPGQGHRQRSCSKSCAATAREAAKRAKRQRVISRPVLRAADLH